jgi:hypothetical protein
VIGAQVFSAAGVVHDRAVEVELAAPDLHLAGGDHMGLALVDIDVVVLEQLHDFEARGADDLVAPLSDGLEVDRERRNVDAVPATFADDAGDLGRFDHGLAGGAAPVVQMPPT